MEWDALAPCSGAWNAGTAPQPLHACMDEGTEPLLVAIFHGVLKPAMVYLET